MTDQTMTAASVTGPGKIELITRPIPTAGPGDVLVDVSFVGLCGSDVHYFLGGRNGIFEIQEPLTLGHELSGRIRAVGSGITGLSEGDRVVVHPAYPAPRPGALEGHGLNLSRDGSYLGSASTWPHTQGALTRVVQVREEQIRLIPDSLPLRRAALAEPLAVALHGVDRAAGALAGARVLVSGAGPIGCLVVAALRERAVASITVVDFHDRALEVAAQCGADRLVRIGEDPLPDTGSFDVVFEAAGAPASLSACIRYTRPAGAIVQLGILPVGDLPVELGPLVSHELTIYGSQRFDIELDEAVRVLADHPELDAVITHQFLLRDVRAALDTASDARTSTKVVVEINGGDS